MYQFPKFLKTAGRSILALFIILSTLACEKDEFGREELMVADASIRSMNQVQITSTGMNFIAPDEIASGWNTFRYMNKTGEPHFFLLIQIPEDKTLEDYKKEVTIPFNNVLDLMRGKTPEGPIEISPWFFSEAVNYGGSGMVEAGGTAVTSINLEPGNYIIECYVKMPNGDFHSVAGMLDQLAVTNEEAIAKQPKADVSLVVTAEGILLKDEIQRPGLHTFSVDFESEPEGARPDIHLVKIEDEEQATEAKLKDWIYWGNIDGFEHEGLMTPAPAGFTFLGGSQEVPQGGRTYFQAVLTPGKYALISEISHDLTEGEFYREFTVK